MLRYLELSWSQTHNQRLASYEIAAALAGLQAANAAAEREAAAAREARACLTEQCEPTGSNFIFFTGGQKGG